MTSGGEQIDELAFFGNSGSSCKRTFRRNVWSTSLQEENQWMQYLMSLSKQRHRNLLNNDGKSHIGCSNIPKIIHFIWLGGNSCPKFPFLRSEIDCDDGQDTLEWNECVESWKSHHPTTKGWEIVVWTEENIVDDSDTFGSIDATKTFVLKQNEMLNKDAYLQTLQIENCGAASDILRLDILNKFGGVYADIDYFCVDCLDDIVSEQAQFFCGASNTGCVELNNGMMACRKGGHPIVTEMIDSIYDYFENALSKETTQETAVSMLSSFLDATTLNALKSTQSASGTLSPNDVIEHTGPGLLTRSVCRWLDTNSECEHSATTVIVFPSHVFHSFPNHLRNNLSTDDDDETTAQNLLMSFVNPKETKAVHLWGCSWQDKNQY